MAIAELPCADLFRAIADGLRPPPRREAWQWADDSRWLPRGATPEPGQWRTGRVPYTREVMASLGNADPCELVVLMKGSQVSGTEPGLNWLGWQAEDDPAGVMVVVPNDAFRRRYMRKRIRPMFDACPALRRVVGRHRSRDAASTISQLTYPGGGIAIASANSASDLASDPVRRVMLDEVDRFPLDVGGEGSPLVLAQTRTTNFHDGKIYMVSSPGPRERSHIEPAFLAGDMRRYFVPCPECGHMDFITWRGLDPFGTEVGGVVGQDGVRRHFAISWPPGKPHDAALLCPECGCLSEERHKEWILSDRTMGGPAEWRPTSAGDGGHTKSYHLPAMYSPLGWLSWSKLARQWVGAIEEEKRGNRGPLQGFVNTRLGECWEEKMDGVKAKPLLDRAEDYLVGPDGQAVPRAVPDGVGVLVASVDVQSDRLEAQVVGYGAGEESWLIDWHQFHGDPESDELWFELDRYLERRWRHCSGRQLPIERVAVDSGGHHTQKVYEYCSLRTERGIFAIKGSSEYGKPLLGKATRNNRFNAPLFPVCVDVGKDRVYARLKIHVPGPGYMHFPRAHWFDEEYVAQLTAEKKVPSKWLKGRGSVPYWKKTRERNEALDLTVYALAALYILGEEFLETLAAEAERWSVPLEGGETPAAAPPSAAPAEDVPPTLPPSGFQVNPFGSGGWLANPRK